MEKDLHPFDTELRTRVENYTEDPTSGAWSSIEKGLDQEELAHSKKQQKRLKRYLLLLLLISFTLTGLLYNNYSTDHAPTKLSQELASAEKTAEQGKTRNTITNQSASTTSTPNQTTQAENNSDLESIDRSLSSVENLKSTEKQKIGNSSVNTPNKENEKLNPEIDPNATTSLGSPSIKSNKLTGFKQRDRTSDKPERSSSARKVYYGRNQKTSKKRTAENDESRLSYSNTAASFGKPRNISEEVISLENSAELVESPAISSRNLEIPKARSGWRFPSPNTGSEKLAALQSFRNPVAYTGKKSSSYPILSAIPFYSYERVDQELGEGRREHREDDRDQIEKGEESKAIAQKGVMVNWQVQKNWGLMIGISQTGNNTEIRPREIYARPEQSGSNDLKYKVSCSAGTGYVTAKTGATTPVFGDSLRALDSKASLRYISVPIAARYALHVNKFTFSVMAGTQLNLLAKKQLTVNYWDASGAKNQAQVNLQGPKSMFVSGLMGASAEYAIRQRLRLFLMPTQAFSLGSINRNSPTSTRQSTTGWRMGLSVGLK